MEDNEKIKLLLQEAPFLQALARCLVWGNVESDDLVQETWVQALRTPPRHSQGLRGWLGRVVRNIAINRGIESDRRSRRETQVIKKTDVPTPAEVLVYQEELANVAQAVKVLANPYGYPVEKTRYRLLPRWQKHPQPPRTLQAGRGGHRSI